MIGNPIIGVAFQSNDRKHLISLLKPNRHNHLYEWIYDHMKGKLPNCNSHWTQGFVTLEGEFLNRSDAADHALKEGQIEKEQSQLFSECLW